MKILNLLFASLLMISFVLADASFAKKGCCRGHDGVCGCADNGKAKCCDGTVSPTCPCEKE